MYFCRKYFRHIPKVFKHLRYSEKVCAVNSERYFNTTKMFREKDKEESVSESEVRGSVASKYEIFTDEKSFIFDIEEERKKLHEINDESEREEKKRSSFSGISSQRGTSGVIEIEELISVLKQEIAQDIVVILIPKQLCYVDYLVIATCRSTRHMVAIAEYIRKLFKFKMNPKDSIPNVEGKNSNKWIALDLGNIVLHLFLESSRLYYDLETLWVVGKEYDSLYNKDNIINLIPDSDIEITVSNATTVNC